MVQRKKITLKQFIEENYRLLSVVGIFGGLSAYFSTIGYVNYFLPFATFLMFVFVCWELWKSFPKSENVSLTLNNFEIIFILFGYAIVGYIITTFKDTLIDLLPLPFIAIYTALVNKLINKYKLYLFVRKLTKKYKNFDFIVRAVFGLAIVFLVFILTIVSFILVRKYLGY